MKRFIALIAITIFTFTVGIAFAEEAQQAPAPRKTSKKYFTINGEVTAVDPAVNSLIIKSKKQEVILTVTDKTKVTIGKEKKSLADVRVGDSATAHYKKENDKNVATSINVIPKASTPEQKPEAPAKK